VAVLPGTAGINEANLDEPIFDPLLNLLCYELRAVITLHSRRRSVKLNQLIKNAYHIHRSQIPCTLDPKRTPCEFVDYRKESKRLPVGCLVRDKVVAPNVVRILGRGEDTLELVAFGYNVFDTDKGRRMPKHIVPIAPIQAADAAPTSQTATLVRKISDAQARKIASRAVEGEIIEVAVERKMGAKRIVVEVISEDGMENDVIIDMVTGEVLAVTQ